MKDTRGQFPLQVAVMNQNEEIINYLFDFNPKLELGDSLLHAIDTGNRNITTKLLDRAAR